MILLISTRLKPPVRSRTTGSSQSLATFLSRFTWICGGSLRSKETKKNRYPSTRRTVGILSPFYLTDAKQRSWFVALGRVRITACGLAGGGGQGGAEGRRPL